MKRRKILTQREQEYNLCNSWNARLDELIENLQEVGARLPEDKQKEIINSLIYLARRDAKDLEKMLKVDPQSRINYIFSIIAEIPRGVCFDYHDIAKDPRNPYRDPSTISQIISQNDELRVKHDVYRIKGAHLIKWLKPTLVKSVRKPRLGKDGLEIVRSTGYEDVWDGVGCDTSKMNEKDRIIFNILRFGYSIGYYHYGTSEEEKKIRNIKYIERAASLVNLPIARDSAGEPEVIYHPQLLRNPLSLKQIIS